MRLRKIGVGGVIGQRLVQAELEEPAEGEVGLGAGHDLAIGEAVVEAQKEDLEHADGIDPGPPGVAVNFREAGAEASEIHVLVDLSEIMAGGDDLCEDALIEFGNHARGRGLQLCGGEVDVVMRLAGC